MPKNVIFCADGTWQGPVGPTASNVLNIFNDLDGRLTVGVPTDPEQERTKFETDGSVSQIAKYIDGVGYSTNWLTKIVGGSVGVGLIARILRGYTFISRNFTQGDSIFVVGFSRGAYTARALGDLIATLGLLDWGALGLKPDGSDDVGYQYAAAVWYQYQRNRQQQSPSPNWLSRLQTLFSEAPTLLPSLALTPQYVCPVTVKAIGVWDTVGSLGIPETSDDDAARLDLLRFVDTALDPNVSFGFHAIAADEHRVDFSPTLWDPDPARVVQIFFPGSHADVGGGFPPGAESQLSDLALSWMETQLAAKGVSLTPRPCAPNGPLGPEHLPWTMLPYSARPSMPREFPSYAGPAQPIGISDVIRARLGQPVPTMTATFPLVTRIVPYVPIALAHAGYIDLSTTVMKK